MKKTKKPKIVENKGITGMGTDYTVYILSKREKITAVLAGFLIGFAASYVYYNSVILGIIIGLICAYKAISLYSKYLLKKRSKELRLQFRDTLESLSNSYTVGLTASRAFHNALSDMTVEHGQNSYIANELRYNTANTLSNTDSTFYLKGSFNDQDNTDVFKKTDNSDVITLTKELSAGKYTFKLYNLGTDKWYGKNDTVITDTANRLVLVNAGNECVLNVTGGIYEFKYEISTNRLSVYSADKAVVCIGDCNDDGAFNIADVVLLQKWLLAVPNVTIPDWKAADLCEDGRLDVFDLCIMKRLLFNG